MGDVPCFFFKYEDEIDYKASANIYVLAILNVFLYHRMNLYLVQNENVSQKHPTR